MRFQHRDGGRFGAISLPTGSLYEDAPIDDDGYFDVPPSATDDELATVARAGHTPVDEDGEPLPPGKLPDAVVDALDEAEAEAEVEERQREVERAAEEGDEDEPDDDLDDMTREELYELYKDAGGPESWNDVDSDDMREYLRTEGGY